MSSATNLDPEVQKSIDQYKNLKDPEYLKKFEELLLTLTKQEQTDHEQS